MEKENVNCNENAVAEELRCRTIAYQMLDLKVLKLQAKKARNKGLSRRNQRKLEKLLCEREKESHATEDSSGFSDYALHVDFLGARGFDKGLEWLFLILCFLFFFGIAVNISLLACE